MWLLLIWSGCNAIINNFISIVAAYRTDCTTRMKICQKEETRQIRIVSTFCAVLTQSWPWPLCTQIHTTHTRHTQMWFYLTTMAQNRVPLSFHLRIIINVRNNRGRARARAPICTWNIYNILVFVYHLSHIYFHLVCVVCALQFSFPWI